MSRKGYPSDVSDEEWALVAPYLTLISEAAPQRAHSLREVFNGLRWMIRTGAPWRMMPHDLPPWFTIYQQAQRWLKAGVFEAVVFDLREILRIVAEKAAQHSFQKSNYYFWELYLIARRHDDVVQSAKYEQMAFNQTVTNNRGARLNRRLEFYMRGTIALENNRPDDALNSFKESLRYLPPGWDINDLEDSLANAYLKTERYDDAIAEYERILRSNPNYPLAHFHLAQAFEGANQPDVARVYYERFLQIWKDADADVPEIIRAKKFLGNS